MTPMIEFIFISTDDIIHLEKFVDEDKFLASSVNTNSDFANAYIDSEENLLLILEFIFDRKINFVELASENNRSIYDLTAYKEDCITFEDLEVRYQKWSFMSKISFLRVHRSISYIRKSNKKYLIMISDKTRFTL